MFRYFIFVFVFIGFQHYLWSQVPYAEEPKIGLVLSGGSAKGLVHIGVLKVLEENNIRPDFITGTSMGSIIGALYAIGYSAEEIERIALGLKWDNFFSNKVPLNKVAFEEKAYYGRYMLEMPIIGFKPELIAGLVEGQDISLTLSKLTKHVHNISDFDDFPIPFRCVATDINTGELVLFSGGSLVEALRASMAIPTLFTPVEKNGKLLVDGGLVRNFPVQEALDMGADIIIGSYAGFSPYAYEKKKTLTGLVSQAAYILTYSDTEVQKSKCDIIIEPDLQDFSASEYDRIKELIDLGQKATIDALPELKEKLGNLPEKISLKPIKKQDNYVFDSIIVSGTETIPEKFIKGKLRLQDNDTVSLSDLDKKISILYGTQYFDKIIYKVKSVNKKNILTIEVKETEPRKLKLSLHYDSENKTRLTTNISMLNVGLPGSKTTLEVDIAEFPRIDFNYFKYLGVKQHMALALGTYSYKNELTFFDKGAEKEAIFNNLHYSFFLKTQRSLSSIYTYGFQVKSNFAFQKPVIANYPYRLIKNMNGSGMQAQLFYGFNTINRPVFATKGDRFNATLSYQFRNKHSIKSIFPNDEISFEQFEPNREYWTLRTDYKKIIPITQRISLITDSKLWVSSTQNVNIYDMAFVGGFNPIYGNTMPYWGATLGQYNTTDFFYTKLEIQVRIKKNLYINGLINYLDTELPVELLFKDRTATDLINKKRRIGYGIQIGYDTVLGPLYFAVAKDNNLKEFYFNVSLGYLF